MKKFFQFLSEATESQASSQARKLGLKSDGHGGWVDSRGEFVAKTEKGKLKFYNQRQKTGEQDPDPKDFSLRLEFWKDIFLDLLLLMLYLLP